MRSIKRLSRFMLKVGLTGRIIYNSQHDEYRECLDVRWAAFVRNCMGALPYLIPSAIDPASYIHEVKISAVILTGGNNVGSISGSRQDVYRDHHESKIIDHSLKLGIPIIGICRGMQMIATYFGQEVKPTPNHTSVTHSVKANEKTRFAGIINNLSPVNSYHDFGVSKVPVGFDALAYASDGVLEAFMSRAEKVYGLMWHPERVASPASQMRHAKLIKEMINA